MLLLFGLLACVLGVDLCPGEDAAIRFTSATSGVCGRASLTGQTCQLNGKTGKILCSTPPGQGVVLTDMPALERGCKLPDGSVSFTNPVRIGPDSYYCIYGVAEADSKLCPDDWYARCVLAVPLFQ